MGVIPARCTICTSKFHSGNISCLPCGHTFHYACVVQWIQQSKTCPQCRCTVLERNVIKQIYFDDPEDGNEEVSSADDYARKCEALSIEVEKEKGKFYELQEKNKVLQNNYDSIADKLEREKKKTTTRIPQLESRNRQLELMLQDHDHLKNDLKDYQNRLKACEFYKLLLRGSTEDAERAIDKYVNGKGDPATGPFLTLLKKQLEESRQHVLKLKNDIKKYDKDLRDSESKQLQFKSLIQALKREAEDLRSSNNKTTPYNPKLQKVFEKASNDRRESFGFETSITFSEDIIDSAFKKPPVLGKIRTQVADVTDENTSIEKTNKLPFPCLDESLDDSVDFSLPKNVLDRILAGSSKKKTNPLGIVPKGAILSLESIKNNIDEGLAPRPIKKPLKRKIDSDLITVKFKK